MAKIISSSANAFGFSTNSATRYCPIGNSYAIFSKTTESDAAHTCRVAGNATLIRAIVKSNGRGTNTTYALMVNGSASALTLTVAGGATGTQSATGSVSISDGDTLSLRQVTSTGSGSIVTQFIEVQFEPSSGSAFPENCDSNTIMSNASTTRYIPLRGANGLSTDERYAAVSPIAGTSSNFQINVSSNARTSTTTFRFRKNGSNGNQTVAYSSGQTGVKEDVTNTDTIGLGDFYNTSITTGSGSGGIVLKGSGHKFDPAETGFILGSTGLNELNSANFFPLCGEITGGATESLVQWPTPFDINIKNMAIKSRFNGSTSPTAVALRIGGVDANQNITIAASTDAVYTDAINTDSASSGDLLNFRATGSNAALYAVSGAIFVTPAGAGGNYANTVNGVAPAAIAKVMGVATANISKVIGV